MEKDIILGFQFEPIRHKLEQPRFSSDNCNDSCEASVETGRMNKVVKEWCSCGLCNIIPINQIAKKDS